MKREIFKLYFQIIVFVRRNIPVVAIKLYYWKQKFINFNATVKSHDVLQKYASLVAGNIYIPLPPDQVRCLSEFPVTMVSYLMFSSDCNIYSISRCTFCNYYYKRLAFNKNIKRYKCLCIFYLLLLAFLPHTILIKPFIIIVYENGRTLIFQSTRRLGNH